MTGDVEQCNHCDGRIIWLRTVKDNLMPVDADPDPEKGNVLRQGGRAGVLGPRQAAGAREAGQDLHLHHRFTCPYADRWARPDAAAAKTRRR